MLIICKYCGKEINVRDKRTKICKNDECIIKDKKYKYKNKKYKKICKYCGKEFFGTENSVKCCNCNRQNKYKKILVRHFCRQCKKMVYEIEKNNITNVTEIYDVTCDLCKKINFENSSKRMIENNPSTLKRMKELNVTFEEWLVIKENKIKYKTIEESRIVMSERMKKNNPMKNKDTINKMKKTLNDNIKNGKTIYKRGKDCSLFKGKRELSQYLFLQFSDVKKKVLERDNYKCVYCGENSNKLEIHHLYPFRNVVNDELFKLNSSIMLSDLTYDDELFWELCKNVRKWHIDNIDLLITVCSYHHSKIDKNRHISKKIKLEMEERENENKRN